MFFDDDQIVDKSGEMIFKKDLFSYFMLAPAAGTVKYCLLDKKKKG